MNETFSTLLTQRNELYTIMLILELLFMNSLDVHISPPNKNSMRFDLTLSWRFHPQTTGDHIINPP